jgi:phage shock protein C
MMETAKKLYRSKRNRMLAGVCGGIAEYLNLDPTIIRLAWIVLSLAYGFGVLGYIIAWLLIPINPY